MIRSPLSALLIAAMGTAALSVMSADVMAQAVPAKAPQPTAGQTTKAPTPAIDDNIVGTCNGHSITWDQLVARIQRDNPSLLNQSVSAIVASKAEEAFFGPVPKPEVTITKAAVLAELKTHPNQGISQQLELMLTELAVDDEATRENVQPTEKQVDDKITALLAGLRANKTIPASQSNEAFLAERHFTMEKLKANFRPQCQILNLINKDVTKQLGHPIGPDDLIQASHLLVTAKVLPATASAAEKLKADEQARDHIKHILADIRAGKITFAAAARADSEDPGSKDKGGDLGIFMRGMMFKEFENASFAAKKDVVTEPVKSQAGYHIILVTKTGKDIPAADRDKFIDKYESDQIQGFLARVVEKDNKVVNKLAALVPQQAAPGGFGGPPQGRPRPQ